MLPGIRDEIEGRGRREAGCSYKRTTQEILVVGTDQNLDCGSGYTNLFR